MALNISNLIILGGRLSADPKPITSKDGTVVGQNFQIVHNQSYYDNDEGEWKEKSAFVYLSAFGRTGNRVAKCRKGDLLQVGAHFETSRKAIDGETRYFENKVCDQVTVVQYRTEVGKDSAKDQPRATTQPDTMGDDGKLY